MHGGETGLLFEIAGKAIEMELISQALSPPDINRQASRTARNQRGSRPTGKVIVLDRTRGGAERHEHRLALIAQIL